MSFWTWFRRAGRGERRRAERRPAYGLQAHYWDGSAISGNVVRDISQTGLYIETTRRWYPGTMVMLTLQQKESEARTDGCSITIQSLVVRCGSDGVAMAFVPAKGGGMQKRNGSEVSVHASRGAGTKALAQFLRRLRRTSGQSLVEYALILPVVLLLIVNMVNFAGFFYAWITVANAARAGADYAILGGASVGAPGSPSGTAVTNVITADVASLPNSSSLVVNVCRNTNGVLMDMTTRASTCTYTPALDPEPTSYSSVQVDVAYTYVPFIPAGFSFPGLNVYATIPPTTIHRTAVMRGLI